jgi:hypothetical protein
MAKTAVCPDASHSIVRVIVVARLALRIGWAMFRGRWVASHNDRIGRSGRLLVPEPFGLILKIFSQR